MVLFGFCFFLLQPTSSMLCHIWRLGSHSPFDGEKLHIWKGVGFVVWVFFVFVF